MVQVVTQLIVDSSGANVGVAAFEAAMARAKAAAVDGGSVTASSFESAQRRWTASLGATDPVIKGQIAMETALARQRNIGADAVRLGIATQESANVQLDRVKQKHEANIAAIKEETGQLTAGERTLSAFGKATSGVSGQLIALSAGAGPVGVFLSALGPWGLAAAVGIGAVATAFGFVAEESARMGAKAVDLRVFADVTGLAIGQIAALRNAGAEAGVAGDTVASSFERMTANLTAARRASGTLFDEIRLVNSGLADQLRSSTTTVQGIDSIAAAYHQAGDDAQRASIARAAFGKAGASLGPVLDKIAIAGGVEQLAQLKQVGEQTDAQTRRWADMQTKIDETNKQAKNILAGIFTEEGLKAALLAAEAAKQMALALRDIASQKEGLNWLQRMMADWARASAVASGADPAAAMAPFAKTAAMNRLQQGQGTKVGVDQKDIDSWLKLEDAIRGILTPAEQAKKTLEEQQNLAAGDAKLEKERIGLLGSAATLDEQRISRLKDLNSALLNHTISQTDYNRAVAATNLDSIITLESRRLGILGAMAPIQEQLAQKEREVIKANREGAGITTTQTQGILELTRAQALGITAMQQQADASNIEIATVGMSTQKAMEYKLVQEQINQALREKRVLTEGDIAAIQKQAEVTAAAAAKAATLKDIVSTARDAAQGFATDIVQGMMQGKSHADTMISALDNISSKLSNKAMSDLFSGDPEKMAMAPIELGVAALASQASKLKKAEQEFQKAQQDWADMQKDFTLFTNTLHGQVVGSLGQSIASMTDQAQKYADAAHKAGVATDQLQADLNAFAARAVRDFVGSFDVMIEALDSGFGPNGVAVQAAANIKSVAETLKGFLSDTALIAPSSAALAKATASVQDYMVSLFAEPATLSAVETRILSLRGSAAQLQTTLQDLGMSAEGAAAAIAAGVNTQLDALRTSFASGIQAKINSAQGKGYLNDLNNLVTQSVGDLSDARLIGSDPRQVAQAFALQAQAIVDQAGLVGDSFNDLVKTFPSLSSVVHQSSTALDQFTTSIQSFLDSLKTGSLSALSPDQKLAAAQDTYARQLSAAQSGDPTAMAAVTQSANDLLTVAKDFFASSPQYAAIFNQIVDQLGALPKVVAAGQNTMSAVQAGNAATQQGNDILGNVDTNTGNTDQNTDAALAQLNALADISNATRAVSDSIATSMQQLGAQTQDIGTTQSSQYFGPMTSLLTQIEVNTRLSGTPAPPPEKSFEWWNPFTWFDEGGVVRGGTPGRDSVPAMLTPDEFVMRADVSRKFQPLLEAMNAGKVPHFAEGGSVGGRAMMFMPTMFTGGQSANDNQRTNFSDLARSIAAGNQAIIARLERLEMAYREGAKEIADTQRITANRVVRPGGTRAA